MSLEKLWRYCGAGREMVLRNWVILAAAMAMPLVPVSASAQSEPDLRAPWVGELGIASYYGSWHQGKRTAFGTRFDQWKLTAAHPWLPFGSKVRVTDVTSGKSVIVTITDRLYSDKRVIDLSTAAARMLGIMRAGIAKVTLEPG
jgi:rare lipoprotein A